jgi:hypothetical protein
VETDLPTELSKSFRKIALMRDALRAAETVMMIVEPRSHKKEYLETLAQVRAALEE